MRPDFDKTKNEDSNVGSNIFREQYMLASWIVGKWSRHGINARGGIVDKLDVKINNNRNRREGEIKKLLMKCQNVLSCDK